MGLSIHYSGSFKATASLSEMIEEVSDIVSLYKWEYTIFENQFPEGDFTHHNQKIYGVSFTPPECETVNLSFLSNRRMSSRVNLKFYGNTNAKPEADYLYMLSVKTQYAGPEIHKWLIHLLKYLNEKYFEHFEMTDEGGYWETLDETLLENIFKRYTALIDGFQTSLESYPKQSNESFQNYIERLLQITRKNKNS